MSKKTNWATVDKRIRERRATWSKEERAAIDASLNKLPDLTEQCDTSEVLQPVVGDPNAEVEAEPDQEAEQVEAPN